MVTAKPYGQLRYRNVNGKRMAYVDEGQGDAIVFAHGNPTSSYLWRNVMPHLEGLGRLVACDMIGMGGSDKLHPSGPGRYHYAEQGDYLFALWDALDLGDNVTLVLQDWGSVLGFDWANQHRTRVRGIAFMEAIVTPRTSDFPSDFREVFQGLRSPEGERMVLEENLFVEAVLPRSIQRRLSDDEMDHYRAPFANPGEDRRPTLSWPRNIPIDGEPADVVAVVNDYALAGRKRGTQAVHQCRTGLYRARPQPRAHPDLAEPDRDHRQRNPLHPGGQPRRDRHGHRRVRPEKLQLPE